MRCAEEDAVVELLVTLDPATKRRIKTLYKQTPKHINEEMRKSFIRAAARWKRALISRNSRGTSGGTQRRTGTLVRGIRTRVTGRSIKSLRATMQLSGVPYAEAQEFGKRIKSNRPNGFLTIPMPAMLTPAGVTRESASSAISREGFVKDGGSLFFKKSSGGNLFLYRQKGNDVEPLFLLRKSIKIPGPKTDGSESKLGFFDTWDKLRPERVQDLRDAVRKATTRGNS